MKRNNNNYWASLILLLLESQEEGDDSPVVYLYCTVMEMVTIFQESPEPKPFSDQSTSLYYSFCTFSFFLFYFSKISLIERKYLTKTYPWEKTAKEAIYLQHIETLTFI